MKILAVIALAPGAAMERVRAELVDELRASWSLYTSGVLREAYATDSPARVVFMLEAASVPEATELIAAMPLVAAGCLRFELTELRPFANWSRLFVE
jgi:hypothetical protein